MSDSSQMTVEVEDKGACRKRMRIEIPAEQVNRTYNEVVNVYAKSTKIPGFRPGKAPPDLVKKRFRKEIEQDVRERLLPEGYQAALEREKIDPVAVLWIEDVSLEAGRPMTFAVTLDVPPAFDLPPYREMALEGEKVDVSDEDVQKAIQGLLESHARYESAGERPVQRDDLVQVDFEGVIEGRPIEDMAPEAKGLGKAEDFWVHAGENAFLPEFADGLLGAQVGERKQVFVDFPSDFQVQRLAGAKATYFVHIKDLRERVLPELNEEYLQSLGVESEDGLRRRVREDLVKMGERRERQRLQSEIIRRLLRETEMELPQSVVVEETKSTIYDMVRENTARGVSEEEIEQKKEEIFQAATRNAGERVKARYILHRIADAEGIEASESDVEAQIASLAAQYQVSEEEMRAQLAAKDMLDGLKQQLRIDKTMDFLLEQAKVKR